MGKNYNILDTNLILSGLIKNMQKQLQALEEVHFNNKKKFSTYNYPVSQVPNKFFNFNLRIFHQSHKIGERLLFEFIFSPHHLNLILQEELLNKKSLQI